MSLLGPGCRFEPAERDPDPAPQPGTEPRRPAKPGVEADRLPSTFACVTTKSVPFEVVPANHVAALANAGAPAPAVSNAQDIVAPWGTKVTITGSGLGDGRGGEYVSFGEGAREIRVPAKSCIDPNDSATCGWHPWSDTRIEVPAPLGAEGKVVVHTLGGAAGAGTFTSPWRSSAALTFAKDEVFGRTLASLDTPEGAFVVRTSRRPGLSFPNDHRLTVHRFTADGVSVAAFDDLGGVRRASLSRDSNGRIDLALVTETSRLHMVRVHADAVEIDDGCVPADALVRLVDERGAGTWKRDRMVITTELVRGDGVELADGSVGFAWGEGASGFFDSKSAAMVAVLPAGAAAVESTQLAPLMDDYVETRAFATSSGFVMTYCNHDDTGFAADRSSSGVRCRVLARTGPREWEPFDGHPNTFENLDHDFGLVAGRIASVYRVSGKAEYAYRASVDASPSVVVAFANEVSFVRADGPPVLFVASGTSAAVIRPR